MPSLQPRNAARSPRCKAAGASRRNAALVRAVSLGLVLLGALSAWASGAVVQAQSSYDRLERAAELIRQNQLARAEAELDALLRARTREANAEANALNLLGVIRAQQKREDEAERMFLRALEASPALVGAYVNLGQLYLVQQRSERAFWAFNEADKLAPERSDVNFQLAGLLVERREFASALARLEKIPRAELGFEHAYLFVKSYLGLGRKAEAQRLFAPVGRAGVLPPEMAARFAVAFAAAGLVDDAISILETARRQTPDSFPVLFNLGACYSQKGDAARAEEFYRAALDVKPDDVPSLRALARLARAHGDFETALSYLTRARKAAPDAAPVLYDFAWTALHMNLLAEARQEFERLRRMQPDEPVYLYALAVAYLMSGETEKSQPLFRRYIELRPQDARGYFVLGVAHYSLRQLKEARAALERSLTLEPFADAEYYLGMIASDEGDSAQASNWWQRAVKSEPAHPAAHLALGLLYSKQKNYTAAREELERAMQLNPRDMSAPYQLGLVYTHLGDKERAETLFALADKLRTERKQQNNPGLSLVDPPK